MQSFRMKTNKQQSWLFPIRFKILILLLSLVTSAVGLITFTMSNLFHADKAAYINDLTSMLSLHTTEEVNSLLQGYKRNLHAFSSVVYDHELSNEQKTRLIRQLFEDFEDFVAVTLYKRGAEQSIVYDSMAFDSLGLTKNILRKHRKDDPLPFKFIKSRGIYLESSKLTEKSSLLTLAIYLHNPEEEKEDVVLAALIRLDTLTRICKQSKSFETFIVDSNGLFLSHTDSTKINSWVPVEWLPDIKKVLEQEVMGTTIESTRNGVVNLVGFGRSELGGLIIGTQIPKSAAYLTARALLSNLIGMAFIMLGVSAVLGMVVSRIVTRSIKHLTAATQIIGKGNFEVDVKIKSRDEIGVLANSFNHMATELKVREVALKESHIALVQSEKMAAFGQLGAGIAHEVKNPLTGILGYAQLTLRKLEPGTALHQNIEIIEKETKRCKAIIENLLKFARQERVKFDPIDVNVVVEDAITIVAHQIAINKIKLEKEITQGLPKILGNANQLQQVLMNLLINAQQAMEGSLGKIKISTHLIDVNKIEILVSDNGPGISKEIQAQIFEPFFTTKPTGKGTGLGLSVSYGIIKEHKGDIRVESEIGQGATFVITLPADGQSALNDPAEEIEVKSMAVTNSRVF